MTTINIRTEVGRSEIKASGFRWLVVSRYGEIGNVISRHRTYDAAKKAARGTNYAIVDVDYMDCF